jgi:hypothetical protein
MCYLYPTDKVGTMFRRRLVKSAIKRLKNESNIERGS